MARAAKFKVPKTIGAASDLYYDLRIAKVEASKAVDEITKQMAEVRKFLVNNVAKSDSAGAVGKHSISRITTEEVPVVEDFEKLKRYIKQFDAWDILTRGINKSAVEARWKAKKKVPGVTTHRVVKVSCVKK